MAAPHAALLLSLSLAAQPASALHTGQGHKPWHSPPLRRWNSSSEPLAQCRAQCGCSGDVAFVAETAAARELYQGCKASGAHPKARPGFVVIGAQKGGTTSAYSGAVEPFRGKAGRFCGPRGWRIWMGEAHFFDQARWLHETPSKTALQKGYLSMWSHCSEMDHVWMEKTPTYLWAPAAPLRICEALPGQQLVALLREPVARAYSAFYKNDKGGAVANTPEGFHTMATADVAISRECGGVPMGDPKQDVAASGDYRTCCRRVTAAMNLTDWPGCDCKVSMALPFACTPYGQKDFAVVRMGLYAPLLRNWYRYHRAEDVLVLFSEDFFRDMPGALCELHCRAGPEGTATSCSGKPEVDFKMFHENSWTAGHPPMLPETRKLLQDFYAPHNEELFSLLGRRAPWEMAA